MPSTKQSARVEAQHQLDRLIRMYISANQSTLASCAKRMKIGEATMYRRMKNTGNFTLAELRVLRMCLGIPVEEMLLALEQKV